MLRTLSMTWIFGQLPIALRSSPLFPIRPSPETQFRKPAREFQEDADAFHLARIDHHHGAAVEKPNRANGGWP